ncbi:MAG: type II toxin-antitoxin system HicA family toxin [Nitrospira sp.]|nr:type II toxin-antitoxin system HicA family toxin [Nitrospira sp.]
MTVRLFENALDLLVRVLTIPGKPNDDIAPGTLNSIYKQADLKK